MIFLFYKYLFCGLAFLVRNENRYARVIISGCLPNTKIFGVSIAYKHIDINQFFFNAWPLKHEKTVYELVWYINNHLPADISELLNPSNQIVNRCLQSGIYF